MKINNYAIHPIVYNGNNCELGTDTTADCFGVYNIEKDGTENWIADFDTKPAAINFVSQQIFKSE